MAIPAHAIASMFDDHNVEDFLQFGSGLNDRFNVDEARADPDDPEEDGVTDRFDKRYDVYRSRWIFLGRYFEDWFSTAEFENQHACSYMAVRFDCFRVQLPFTTAQSQASDAYLQRLRDATELVGLMLRVDVNTWQFVKKDAKSEFRFFQVSSYEPEELQPKMKFVLSQRWGDAPDQPAAIQRLRFMLLECDRQVNPQERGGEHFCKNKTRILKLDTENKLRGWKIPIAIQLTPQEPNEATGGVEPVKLYLQETIALIRELLVKGADETNGFAFRLVEVSARLFTTRASDLMEELRELKSLGVAVTFTASRPPQDGLPQTDRPRDNVYPLLADAVSSTTSVLPTHSFFQRDNFSTIPLLSAVASASTLRELSMALDVVTHFASAVAQAKWLAYALRMNRGLQVLELRGFMLSIETLFVMQAVVDSPDPARVLSDQYDFGSTVETTPQFIKLKPDALVTTANGDHRTVSQLDPPPDWEFAVVGTQTESAATVFVVPGHGICSAAEADVASIRSSPVLPSQSQLTTLVLNGPRPLREPTHRFLQLFGRSLEDLRWSMAGNQRLNHEELERDLVAILATCPQLKSLSLESSDLSSLTLFTQHFQSLDCKLQSLALLDVNIPQPALLEFFAAVGDPTTKIAQKLEKLYVYAGSRPLNAEATEAALQMLATNRRLRHVTLCVDRGAFASHKTRFQELEEALRVRIDLLPLASKLAFLSAHRHHHSNNSGNALGRLDDACMAPVFEFAALSARRRIQFLREDF